MVVEWINVYNVSTGSVSPYSLAHHSPETHPHVGVGISYRPPSPRFRITLIVLLDVVSATHPTLLPPFKKQNKKQSVSIIVTEKCVDFRISVVSQ